LHVVLLAGLALCGLGSWVEWTRALEGRTVAWVYAFEWPLFAVLGTAMWWRLLRVEVGGSRVKSEPRPRAEAIAADDPGLAAWQDYLSRLHATDPPGGPPG
jgi:hypothetical protein